MQQYKQLLDRPNILVAGGAGFIGSHVCDRLVTTANVICIDNFITSQEENIDLLLKNPNFVFIKHDLREAINLEKFSELNTFKIKFQGIQQIYNFACPTSPRDYEKFPIETLETNALATKNLLDLALKYKAKLVHASTSAIYGEPKDAQPFAEDYWGFIDPIGPRSCYNEGKRFAESLVVNYGEHRELDWKIVRIFNTYGPRLRVNDGRLIPDFVVKAITNQPLIIFGSPHTPATFCYINDLVDGLVKLMQFDGKGVFNLGNPEVHQIGEVAAKIISLTNSQSKVEIDSQVPAYIVRQGIPDITKIKEQLGWFPLVPLDQGLKKTIDYLIAHRNILGIEH
ncbi:MAG: GDP-mannose 4,6-dehydratase [Patescibacteria group bacterium]